MAKDQTYDELILGKDGGSLAVKVKEKLEPKPVEPDTKEEDTK